MRAMRGGVVGFAVLCAAAVAAAFGWMRCPLAALYHIPCPGCGMTRAILLLASGHVRDSLRMNALASPVLVASAILGWAAFAPDGRGPGERARLHVALTAAVVTYGAAVALWALRWFGLFGGPVPV
jgi:hypothetical protein